MKKTLVITLLAALAALTLVGCGGEDTPPTLSDPNEKIIHENILEENILEENVIEEITVKEITVNPITVNKIEIR